VSELADLGGRDAEQQQPDDGLADGLRSFAQGVLGHA